MGKKLRVLVISLSIFVAFAIGLAVGMAFPRPMCAVIM